MHTFLRQFSYGLPKTSIASRAFRKNREILASCSNTAFPLKLKAFSPNKLTHYPYRQYKRGLPTAKNYTNLATKSLDFGDFCDFRRKLQAVGPTK